MIDTNLHVLCATYLRMPTVVDGVFVFEPPLSPAEQLVFADLQLMSKFGVTMTLVEWQGIRADAAGLKAYAALPSPTLAQTVAAVRAQSRILATIVRS